MPTKINSDLVCVHTIEGSEKLDELHKISTPDIRSNKPFGYHDQKSNQTAFFQPLINGKISGHSFSVAAPNEIALALSVTTKSLLNATKIRNKIRQYAGNKKIIFKKEVTGVYNLLEEMQKAIVFSYRAVEVFCNACIPDNYVYRKTNGKGIVEEYHKELIERWITTSEKISSVLPEILKCTPPVSEKFWSDFKKLELLRNDIVHNKSTSSKDLLSELFSDVCDNYINSTFLLLQYFIKLDPTNQIFPLGFGASSVRVTSVPDVTDHLKKIQHDNIK